MVRSAWLLLCYYQLATRSGESRRSRTRSGLAGLGGAVPKLGLCRQVSRMWIFQPMQGVVQEWQYTTSGQVRLGVTCKHGTSLTYVWPGEINVPVAKKKSVKLLGAITISKVTAPLQFTFKFTHHSHKFLYLIFRIEVKKSLKCTVPCQMFFVITAQ